MNLVIALIAARERAKGLPRKNIVPVNGAPLIGWSINAALGCKTIDRVFVSTEDSEIASISKQMGAEVIERPLALAGDNSSSISVVSPAIEWLKYKHVCFDSIALV